ncbi:MAG TPA: hypothetical protein VFD94_08810 [Jatrophihabitans sp.]|nr:hypothetical protein [Jatrophihabitans sp.]
MRVLVWNILSFTLVRVFDTSGNTPAEVMDSADKSWANTGYILRTLAQADPDIFVVIEARSGQGPIGELAGGNGPAGLLYLLAQFRNSLSANWCLVPPLRVNPQDILGINTHTESVGVFWRDDRLAFTGPMRWPAANNATGPAIAPGGGATANYPPPWNAAVPGGLQNAALCRFFPGGGQELLFNDAQHRRPYLTTFTERNAPGRNMNLFSVHFKPGVNARTASARLSEFLDNMPPAANMFHLAVGDFNVDLINPDMLQNAALQLWGPGWADFTRVSPPGNAQTMVLNNNAAVPGAYLRNLCLDYGFVRYGAGAAPAVGQGPVAGVAEQIAGTAPAAPLPGFATDMQVPLAMLAHIPGGIVNQTAVFRNRWNYGHLSPPEPGTSDHLPVLLQV